MPEMQISQNLEISQTLNSIVRSPRQHAMFLNSLAYLEYRGFRKIVMSHSTEEVSYELLKHCAEEVRHAVFFKRQAVRTGGEEFNLFTTESMLNAQEIKSYFFEIDAFARERIPLIKNPKMQKALYLLVTWMIELRAIEIYEEYELVLREAKLDFSLAAILREESHHLSELGTSAKTLLHENAIDTEIYTQFETKQFEKLWTAIQSSVAPILIPAIEIPQDVDNRTRLSSKDDPPLHRASASFPSAQAGADLA